MYKFDKLFQPVRIGGLEIKNRIVMAPMGTCLANENGAVTSALIDYYVERAKGGVGLIIVENASVLPIRDISRLGIFDDQLITGLRELVEKIKESALDVKVFVQLNQHVGGQLAAGKPAPTVNNLSGNDIANIKKEFIKGARRAKRVEFDGIEVHGAHRYLINQFLSPFYNHRTDKYGGSIEKNMRFALEVIEGIRAEVGASYPIMFRQNGSDFVEKGLSVEDASTIAKQLSKTGVDAIHVSAGIPESSEWTAQPMGFEPGCLIPLAEQIKKAISIPVVAVGKINDPILANSIIEQGKADMVALGRGLLADPEFPVKTQEGRTEEIRKCIACRYCMSERINKGFQVRCKINPTVGRERDLRIVPTQHIKTVMVAGGGPAGLEAASVAKRRGHSVRLFESRERLGGQLLLGMAPPCKKDISDFIKNLENQVRQLDIPITLNFPVTAEFVQTEKPEVVVLATGAKPWIPDIQGVDQENVVTYEDILTQNVRRMGNKIVIAGGAEIGCECADYIRNRDYECQITIIEMIDEAAAGMETVHRRLLLGRLRENKVTILTKTRLIEISEHGAVAERKGKREIIPADLIVLAMGSVTESKLAQELRSVNLDYYQIGDCFKIGKIEDAILSAWQTAFMF